MSNESNFLEHARTMHGTVLQEDIGELLMIPSPTNDSGGSGDGRGAEVKGPPGLARRAVSARRHGLHHEAIFLVFQNESTATRPELSPAFDTTAPDHTTLTGISDIIEIQSNSTSSVARRKSML